MSAAPETVEIEVFELTAVEIAAQDDDMVWEYLKRPAFRLATMNGRVREAMLDAMVEENGIRGGWYYAFAGDATPDGPWATRAEAVEASKCGLVRQ